MHEVVYCNLRRSLCYPLYRHWQLAQAVLQDTRDLFHLGNYTSTKHILVGSVVYWSVLSQETFVLPVHVVQMGYTISLFTITVFHSSLVVCHQI